jgi:hypothetical protein
MKSTHHSASRVFGTVGVMGKGPGFEEPHLCATKVNRTSLRSMIVVNGSRFGTLHELSIWVLRVPTGLACWQIPIGIPVLAPFIRLLRAMCRTFDTDKDRRL